MKRKEQKAIPRYQNHKYEKLLTDAQKWEMTVHKYRKAAEAELKAHEELVRSGAVVKLDERGEIFRIYQFKCAIEQQQEEYKQILIDTGLTVTEGNAPSISWDENDPRFQDPYFAPHLYGIIRQHQQTHEELILLNMAVRRAEERGISRRNALLAVPILSHDFQLKVVPLWEYNLLRKLHLDDDAMAMLTGITSARTSIRRLPRLTEALDKTCREEGEGVTRRAKLREQILSAIAELPHVDGQLDTSAEGIKRFFDFRKNLVKQLSSPPGTSSKEVLALDLTAGREESEQFDLLSAVPGGEDPFETVMARASAEEYGDMFHHFFTTLSAQQKEMVAAVKQLEDEKGAGNYSDADIAGIMGIATPNIPNLRQRMAKKLKQIA
jgi:hypothetical protein